MHNAARLFILLAFVAGAVSAAWADSTRAELLLLRRFAPPLIAPSPPVLTTVEADDAQDPPPDLFDTLLSELQADDPLPAQVEIKRVCARAEAAGAELAGKLTAALQSSALIQPVTIEPSGAGLFSALNDIARAFEAAADRVSMRARREATRVFLLQRLAEVATAAQLPALLPLVDESDAAVGHAALQAIASIPGPEASRALGRAAQSGYADRQLAAVCRLGERHDVVAREALQTLAGVDNLAPETQRAVVASLAAHGVPPGNGGDDAQVSLLALRAARAHESAGENRQAANIYDHVAAHAARRHQLRAAIIGLSHTDPERARTVALSTLTTPGIRQTAIQVLSELPGRSDHFLHKAYDTADPATKAALLYVFAARAEDDLPELLVAAGVSDDPVLRYVSAELSGMLPPAEDLFWLSQNGDPWLRNKALRAFLDTAHADAIEGNQLAAREKFVAVTQGSFAVNAKVEALDGLAGVAQAGDSAFARQYLDHPDLAPAAARLLATVIPAEMDPDEARVALEELAQHVGGDRVRAAAVDALATMGVDTESLVNAAGYVTQWKLLGPIPRMPEENVLLAEPLFEPAEVGAAMALTRGDVVYRWTQQFALGVPATLDIGAALEPPATGARACLLARLNFPGWTPADLQIGSTAPYVLWLNGEVVATGNDNRAFRADEDRVSVKFRPGTNRIYVQTLQPGGPWLYGVRITNRRGQALDLTQTRRPDDGLTGVGVQMEGAERVTRDSLP